MRSLRVRSRTCQADQAPPSQVHGQRSPRDARPESKDQARPRAVAGIAKSRRRGHHVRRTLLRRRHRWQVGRNFLDQHFQQQRVYLADPSLCTHRLAQPRRRAEPTGARHQRRDQGQPRGGSHCRQGHARSRDSGAPPSSPSHFSGHLRDSPADELFVVSGLNGAHRSNRHEISTARSTTFSRNSKKNTRISSCIPSCSTETLFSCREELTFTVKQEFVRSKASQEDWLEAEALGSCIRRNYPSAHLRSSPRSSLSRITFRNQRHGSSATGKRNYWILHNKCGLYRRA